MDTVIIERPAFGKYFYIRGEKPRWNAGDVIVTILCGGEIEYTIKNVEFDESLDDWVYTFDSGEKSEESWLIQDGARRKIFHK